MTPGNAPALLPICLPVCVTGGRLIFCRSRMAALQSPYDPVFPLDKLQQRDPDHPVVIAHIRDIWSI
jgi:hypothetical protein